MLTKLTRQKSTTDKFPPEIRYNNFDNFFVKLLIKSKKMYLYIMLFDDK